MKTHHIVHFALFALLLSTSVHAAMFSNAPTVTKPSPDEIQRVATASDHVAMLYFYREDCLPCREVEAVVTEFSQKMEKIVKTYAIQCDGEFSEELARVAPVCLPENADAMPGIVFYEPAKIPINPYTKQPMQGTPHQYQGAASSKSLEAFAAGFIPFWGKRIASLAELEGLLADKTIPNKVLLFTTKKEAPLVSRGLSAEFRDRLEFIEVHVDQEEVLKKYGVETLPAIIVDQVDQNKQEVFEGQLKINEIAKWLEQFALKEKARKEEASKTKENKEEKKKDSVILSITPENYKSIFNLNDRPLVLQVIKGESLEVMAELVKEQESAIHYASLDVSASEENAKLVSEKFGSRSAPFLVMYPIGDEARRQKSRVIMSAQVTKESIMEEILDTFRESVRSLNEQDLQIFINNAVTTSKLGMIYMGNDSIPLWLRIITSEPKYEKYLLVAEAVNPTQSMMKSFNVRQLPSIVGAFLKIGGEYDPDLIEETGGQVQVFHYSGPHNLEEFKKFLDNLIQGIEGETPAHKQKKIFQVTSQSVLDEYCGTVARGACLIAVLDGREVLLPSETSTSQ